MARVLGPRAGLAIDEQPVGRVERGVVGHRGGADGVEQALFRQHPLDPGELGDRERAFPGVIAAGVKERDDRRATQENFVESRPLAGLVLEQGGAHELARRRRAARLRGDERQRAAALLVRFARLVERAEAPRDLASIGAREVLRVLQDRLELGARRAGRAPHPLQRGEELTNRGVALPGHGIRAVFGEGHEIVPILDDQDGAREVRRERRLGRRPAPRCARRGRDEVSLRARLQLLDHERNGAVGEPDALEAREHPAAHPGRRSAALLRMKWRILAQRGHELLAPRGLLQHARDQRLELTLSRGRLRRGSQNRACPEHDHGLMERAWPGAAWRRRGPPAAPCGGALPRAPPDRQAPRPCRARARRGSSRPPPGRRPR